MIYKPRRTSLTIRRTSFTIRRTSFTILCALMAVPTGISDSMSAEENGYTINFAEFSRITSRGEFTGCSMLLKIVARDHVYNVGTFVAMTLNFSSHYFYGKDVNYKMKVFGWDISGVDDVKFDQFEVDYAFLSTGSATWARREQASFINDKCFNAVYWGESAIEFGLASIDDRRKLSYSRKGGTLDAVIELTLAPESIAPYLQAKADMVSCMVELLERYR